MNENTYFLIGLLIGLCFYFFLKINSLDRKIENLTQDNKSLNSFVSSLLLKHNSLCIEINEEFNKYLVGYNNLVDAHNNLVMALNKGNSPHKRVEGDEWKDGDNRLGDFFGNN